MKTISDVGFQVLSANREMMKFNGGPLLKDVIQNMEKTIAFSKCPKKVTRNAFLKEKAL